MNPFRCRLCGEFKFFSCTPCENEKLYWALVGTHEDRERLTGYAWFWWTRFLCHLHDGRVTAALCTHRVSQTYVTSAECAEQMHRRYLSVVNPERSRKWL